MPGKTFSAAEIAKHTEEEDCWLVIHGKVYDVTKYLDEHPGGPEIMVSNAGSEAGEEFEDIGHSDEAMEDMKKYQIGTVENYDPETYKSSGSSGGGGGGGMMNIILILLLLAAAGFAYTQLGGEGGSEL